MTRASLLHSNIHIEFSAAAEAVILPGDIHFLCTEEGKGMTDSLEVLPAQVRACPHGCVSEERRQSAGRPLLVVRPGQQLWCTTNARPPVQALLAVERSTGSAMGKGQGDDEEGEAEVEGGRPIGGRKVQPSGARLLAVNLRGTGGAAGGGKLGQ